MSQVDNIWNKIAHLGDKVAEFGEDAAQDVDQALNEVADDLEGFLSNLLQGLERNPEPVFAVLRRVKPCVTIGNYSLITRYDQVIETLGQHEVFPVTYGPNIKTLTENENFIMGMEHTPRYTYDKSILWLAFRRTDADSLVRPIVERAAADAIAQANGRLDVIMGLLGDVKVEVVRQYFGIDVPRGDGKAFVQDAMAMSRYIFTDMGNEPDVERAAKAAAGRVSTLIQDSIDALERNGPPPYDQCETALGRLVALRRAQLPELTDKRLRAMLVGMISAFLPTNTAAAGNALDELLDRSDALAGAQAAAREDDVATLHSYFFEALRFNPQSPGWFRTCNQPYTVPGGGIGGLSDATIPKGTEVLIATQSAMFDERRISDPHEFRLDRPSWHFLHYGHGLHSCFGFALANLQIPRTFAALLRQTGLRRADGEAGKLHYDGPFPSQLTLCWNTST